RSVHPPSLSPSAPLAADLSRLPEAIRGPWLHTASGGDRAGDRERPGRAAPHAARLLRLLWDLALGRWTDGDGEGADRGAGRGRDAARCSRRRRGCNWVRDRGLEVVESAGRADRRDGGPLRG